MIEFDSVLKRGLVYWGLNHSLNAMEEFEYCINEGHSCSYKLALLRFHYCVIRLLSLT